MNTIENLRQIIEDMTEDEEASRRIANTVLTDLEVYGDRYSVPNVSDIIELLVKKIK